MPVRSLKQGSFFDPRVAAPSCLVVGSVPWLLAHWRDVLCPPWLVAGWRGSGRMGRCAWPAPVLMTLLILRWVEEGTSRVGSMRRAKSDIVWRAAMGLESGGPTPSERTMRDFEAFLRERAPASDLPRYLLLHEHIVHLARWSCSAADPTWAMDSTPHLTRFACLETGCGSWRRRTRRRPGRHYRSWPGGGSCPCCSQRARRVTCRSTGATARLAPRSSPSSLPM